MERNELTRNLAIWWENKGAEAALLRDVQQVRDFAATPVGPLDNDRATAQAQNFLKRHDYTDPDLCRSGSPRDEGWQRPIRCEDY